MPANEATEQELAFAAQARSMIERGLVPVGIVVKGRVALWDENSLQGVSEGAYIFVAADQFPRAANRRNQGA